MKSTRLQDFDYSIENQGYFVTCNLKRDLPEAIKKDLLDILLGSFEQFDFECSALVIMKDHVHFVARKVSDSNWKLSDLICGLKSLSVHVLKKKGLVETTIWQKNYYEHVLRGQVDWVEKVNYIVANPVRGGLVDQAHDYEFLFVEGLSNGATQGRTLR